LESFTFEHLTVLQVVWKQPWIETGFVVSMCLANQTDPWAGADFEEATSIL
jgi:hypothetical protein